MRVILGGGAQHGGAADVDVFDRLLAGAIRTRHGLLERIEVDHQQVDGGNAVFLHDGVVDAAAAEQSAVNTRMQGLDATVHDFRKVRQLANLTRRNGVGRKHTVRATRGNDFRPVVRKCSRQFEQACLVGH